MVIALLGIVGAIAVPRLGASQSERRAEAARRRFVADLELARAQARAGSEHRGVRVNAAGDWYAMMELTDSGAKQLRRIDLADHPSGAGIGSVQIPNNSTIWFDGHGLPASGAKVRVGLGRSWWLIAVDSRTGRVAATRSAAP